MSDSIATITNKTPQDAAEILRGTVEATPASSNQSVTLGFSAGVFVLGWSATNINSYDWVGLYRSINDPDGAYLTYQWATRGASYTTSGVVQAGYQARYLVWNATTSQYNSVVKTDPFPVVRICSA